MRIIFVGFTLLLTLVLPIGEKLLLLSLTLLNIGRGFSTAFFYFAQMASNFLFSAVLIAIFFKIIRLRERLPNPVSKNSFMVAGVVLSLICMFTLTFSYQISNGRVNELRTFIIPLYWISNILLFIGAVKVLLDAKPKPD